MQAATAENEQMGCLILAIEKVSSLTNRGAIYKKLYQPGGITLQDAVDNLQNCMTEMYSIILQTILLCHRLFSKTTAKRVTHAFFNLNEVSEYIAKCEQLEEQVEHEAHNCERARSQEADVQTERLLKILHDPIVRTDERVLSLLEKVKGAERFKILDWTSSVLYGANHQTVKEERTPSTCGWLLNHKSYHTWQEASSSNILWLCGTGKFKITGIFMVT